MADSICTEQSHHVVGGIFGLSSAQHPSTHVPFLRPSDLLLANARSGLDVLLEELAPPRVWLPSFLCPVLLTIAQSRAAVQWYDVGDSLCVRESEWIETIADDDLVVVINYFGYRNPVELLDRFHQRGAVILEDACQALLTADTGERADYVLFSPRKFVGVPDGGVLSSRHSQNTQLPHPLGEDQGEGCCDTSHPNPLPGGEGTGYRQPLTEWWQTALSAAMLRAEFDEHGGDNHWFSLFQQCEATVPVGRFAMSDLSRHMLHLNFDYNEIALRRRENYRTLWELLEEFAIMPELESTVVPLGFPLRMQNRDEVREKLFSEKIFPPVHWAIEGIVPERFAASHRLALEIMTLPCDQRYDMETMCRMADLVREKGVPCKAI